MGMHYYTEVGFYFKVKQQSKEISNIIQTCINRECNQHGKLFNQKFCSECGGKVQEIKFTKNENTAASYKLLPDSSQELISSFEGLEETCWVLNFKIEDKNIFCQSFEGNRGSKAFKIPYNEIEEKIFSLKENNKKIKEIIEYMTNTYGQDSIELEYGVFSYYC